MEIEMIGTNIFQDQKVRLCADDPETLAQAFSRWERNDELWLMLDSDPVVMWSAKKIKEWNEKGEIENPPKEAFFTIHALPEDKLIGFVSLNSILWNQGDCWVAIGLGERDYWGKGYGTEAMNLTLQYAFSELNLRRVTLGVFEYNQRAVHSYEKAGFRLEGRMRGMLQRQGRRYDLLFMGILQDEWKQLQSQAPA